MRPAGAVGQSHTKLTERTASKLHLLHSLRLTRLQALCLAQLLSLWGCLAHRGGRRCLQQHMILKAATCSSLALEITYLARSSWQVAAGMQHQ